MDLKFKLIPSKFFINQTKSFSQKEKDIISSKLKLLKENPFRFKSLEGYKHLLK